MSVVLGLVASARRWGNSELLVRQALQGARAEGASVRMIRLTDLRLESCTGCMRCVIGSKPCPLGDDMSWLIAAIQDADALVLASPTYFLGPAAVIKLVLDRLLMVTGRLQDDLPPIQPAVTLAVAGLQDWRGVTLPYLNALVTTLGYQPIESISAFAPGPGEVLLDDKLMDLVFRAGHRLGRGDLERSPADLNVCPVCRCDAFVLSDSQATCPICGQKATVEQNGEAVTLRFDSEGGVSQRWTPEGMRAHMTDWVMATGPRYLAHRHEIRSRRKPFREVETEWRRPPDRSVGGDVGH